MMADDLARDTSKQRLMSTTQNNVLYDGSSISLVVITDLLINSVNWLKLPAS